MLEQQFVALLQQAANSTTPIKITISKDVPIYDNFDKKMITRVASVSFANNAWEKKYKECETNDTQTENI